MNRQPRHADLGSATADTATSAVTSSATADTAAVYMHLPWCMRKCPYCDFNSHKAPDSIPQSRYVDALLKDFRAELRRAARLGVEHKCISTIFIGGGTPSLFDPDNITILLQGIDAGVPLAADCEITLEANPGTLESARLYGFRRAGINRLSLGVQSLNDKFLHIIGREHDSAQARVAIEQALCAGFGRVNIDLMYGLPRQSTEEALEDLAAAGRFKLNHLSWYELTIEPNTAFGWRPPAGLPDEDKSLAMREAGHAWLNAAGLKSYEVSAWTGSPDDRCRHNLNYWNYGDYIGIGAGAHGKLTLPDTGQVLRSRKTRSPLTYMKQCLDVPATMDEDLLDTLAQEAHELVDPERACDEFLLNALRLTDGFSLDVWQQRTRTDAQILIDATAGLVEAGCLRLENGRLAATADAAPMLDEIIAEVCTLVDRSRAQRLGTATKRGSAAATACAGAAVADRGTAKGGDMATKPANTRAGTIVHAAQPLPIAVSSGTQALSAAIIRQSAPRTTTTSDASHSRPIENGNNGASSLTTDGCSLPNTSPDGSSQTH